MVSYTKHVEQTNQITQSSRFMEQKLERMHGHKHNMTQHTKTKKNIQARSDEHRSNPAAETWERALIWLCLQSETDAGSVSKYRICPDILASDTLSRQVKPGASHVAVSHSLLISLWISNHPIPTVPVSETSTLPLFSDTSKMQLDSAHGSPVWSPATSSLFQCQTFI